MKTNQSKKIIYWITSGVAAVFVIAFGIFINTNNMVDNSSTKESLQIVSKEDKTSQIELNINKYEQSMDIDVESMKIDGQIKQITELNDKFRFIDNVKIPSSYKLTDKYMIYTRKDTTEKNYDILHDYVFTYRKNETDTIIIAFSEIGKPLRDYYLSEDAEISKIEDTECKIYQYTDNIYMATFKINDIYFDIETNGITEGELVELLQSIIKN